MAHRHFECLFASWRVHTHFFFLPRRHKVKTSPPTSCVGFSTGFRILQRMCVDVRTETVFLCQPQKKKVSRGNRSTNSKQTWLHEAEQLTCFLFLFFLNDFACNVHVSKARGNCSKDLTPGVSLATFTWHQGMTGGGAKRHLLCESD